MCPRAKNLTQFTSVISTKLCLPISNNDLGKLFNISFKKKTFNFPISQQQTTNLVSWSISKQNENILKECIDSKYNLNEQTPFYCFLYSPLMLALKEKNNLNIIKLLINNGADLNHVNYWGESVSNFSLNDEYSEFLQSIGAEKTENTTKGMSDLTVKISNISNCTPTTKEAVNQVDSRGLTPFLWAIFYRHQSYVDYYLRLGADVNQAGKNGVTPLMMAVFRNNFSIVEKVVQNGANMNVMDDNGVPAIAYYYFSCPVNILDYLVANGAKIDPSDSGRSPLMMAAIQNDKTWFRYFLNRNADVNFVDSDGNSVLSYAILNKNTKNAEKLIARGADVDLCGAKGKTPLAWSVFLDNPGITQFLLDNGAKINFTDYKGRTALYYAEKYGYAEIVQLLKENGATFKSAAQNEDIFSAIEAKDIHATKKLLDTMNIYKINQQNETVIDVAVRVGDLDIVNLLLDKENELFVHIALPAAIQCKNVQLVRLLLERGANVNRIYRKRNESPLLQAVNQQNAQIVELLLMYNAIVCSNEDPSPFWRALQLGKGKIIELMMAKGVDLNRTENGKCYLEMAADDGSINAIVFLLKNGADPRAMIARLRELAKKSDKLEILLENILIN